MRLICLDDDPRIETVLSRFLKRFGHTVDLHTSVASFKAALASDLPDLILLDLGLGQENGINVIHWLAEVHPRMPLILLSGHGDDLLDTARRIARATGIQVLGAITKSRMVAELPALLDKGITGSSAGPKPDLQGRHETSRQELEWAIRNGGIVPHFQPIVSPVDGHLIGAEVLARLRLADGRILGAGDFIPLAESIGLIHEVTEALFERLIASAEWLVPLSLTFLSVNLSPLVLQQERALVLVRHLVEGFAGICAIKIEMTETAASAYPEIVLSVAAQIHLMGVSLAIDDFGIGYSSMRALAELPFDTLKVDLSFVSEMFDSPKALRLLRAMICFGQTLELQVVAEGVETEAQRRALIAAGVDLAQGYLFGKPMTVQALVQAFAVPAAGVEPAGEMTSGDPEGPIADGNTRKTLLVVDDDERLLQATSRLASSWGYRCETYSDARAALRVCEASPPALMIVDIYMPELDGIEVIQRMRQIAPATRILAVSGDVVQGQPTHVLEMCQFLGADAVLQKPIAPERLRATLERLIGGPMQDDPVPTRVEMPTAPMDARASDTREP
jgi:EAL domain-containing protein (putative c-di-GMP-specific phosphodiesterase class I)/DNA-binding response OmpR family regulator